LSIVGMGRFSVARHGRRGEERLPRIRRTELKQYLAHAHAFNGTDLEQLEADGILGDHVESGHTSREDLLCSELQAEPFGLGPARSRRFRGRGLAAYLLSVPRPVVGYVSSASFPDGGSVPSDCEAAQGGKCWLQATCQPRSYVRLEAYSLLGCTRGIGSPRRPWS
jgi:hypothetical protein